MRVAIITANTAVYREKEEDTAGKVIRKLIEQAGHTIVFQKALPCDRTVLSTVMQRMADGHLTDLILTTGGAGCNAMKLTKRSMLNRSAAGIRGDVLIVNLPGKAGAVKQCLEYLLPEITHAVEVIQKAPRE